MYVQVQFQPLWFNLSTTRWFQIISFLEN